MQKKLETEIIKDVDDQNFYKKILKHAQTNKEFKSFLKLVYQDQKNFIFLNIFQNKIEKYFNSFEKYCDRSSQECKQDLKNYRFTLSWENPNIFLNLKKCFHFLPYHKLLHKKYLYKDFPDNWIDENLIDRLNVPKDKKINELIDIFKKFLEQKTITNSLFISSKKNINKILLWIIIFTNKFIKETQNEVIFINSSNLLNLFNEENNNLKQKLKTVKLLVINDLGLETRNYDFRDLFLFPLIKKRFNSNLHTFLISNFLFQELKNYYTYRYGKIQNKSEKIKVDSFFDFLQTFCQTFEI